MKFLVLTLALTSLACACGLAQPVAPDPLELDGASIAFIKNINSKFIDSISINTSTDKVPYGFAFPKDTLLLDIEVLLPVDELTIETFARGKSLGKQNCWVDPPSANVYLSVKEGQASIDSVGLSEVDRWYRTRVQETLTLQNLNFRKYDLAQTVSFEVNDLIGVRFIEAYLSMPNLTSTEAYYLWRTMEERSAPIRGHPDFEPLLQHAKLLGDQRPALFKKLMFLDVKRRLREFPKPTTDLFVLEIYQQKNPVSQKNHEILMLSENIDSILQIVPFISLASEDSHALWSLYVKDGKFKWIHGLHAPNKKVPSLEKWAIFPNSTYLLMDKKFNLIGAYPNLQRMAAGVSWYIQGKEE